MSKLQKSAAASQVLILGSLFWGVWLYASYLAHHRVYDLGIYRWINNRSYSFDWPVLFLVVLFFGIGLLAQWDAKRSGFKWHKSDNSSQAFGNLGGLCLLVSFLMSFAVLIFWLGQRNSFNVETPLWTWSMWWSITIGWLAITGIFCIVQAVRLEPPQSDEVPKELSVMEKWKDIPTDKVIRVNDETFVVLYWRLHSSTDPEEQRLITNCLSTRRRDIASVDDFFDPIRS